MCLLMCALHLFFFTFLFLIIILQCSVYVIVNICVYKPGGVPDKLCVFPADES